jgi:Kae1-associated kinase Bud32
MRVINRGAEAVLYIDTFEDQQALVKERIKKNYRIDEIDEKIRKTRTKAEVKLLTESRKIGVLTPKIFFVDETNHKIIMEFIDGIRIKELFYASDKKTIEKICFEIGKIVGKLHSAGIIHGDLTTSNMILKDNKIYLIDFGLGKFSKKLEDQGVDLNLLYEALRSTHFKILKLCWENIVKGYKKEYKNAEEVLKRMEEIEKRARYMER